jgi:membrane-bound lytic murein transglycosylase A
MKQKVFLSILLIISAFICGCKAKPKQVEGLKYDKQLPLGASALRKITNPDQIPDFTLACMDLAELRGAIDKSLSYLNKPSSKKYFPVSDITHSQVVDSLKAFAGLLDSGLSGNQLNAAIRDKFDVYMSVGCDDEGTVLFTGYYTPIFDGSFTRTERFCYPLNTPPDDLVKGSDGEILGRRMPDGQITKYPPRAVIEGANMLRGKELVWLGDPFEAYIAQVQGSAKIKLPDGKLTTVGYAANNGHEYHSVAEELIKDGKIPAEQMSLSAMIEYFKKHIDEVARYVRRNPRYVFFKKEEGSPRGSLNEPVTPMRTIATDKSIFPRGCLTFISTTLPRPVGSDVVKQVYSGFALDQDTGGAIRAPGRCDVYMGVGDTAGKLAGQTYQEGKLYYLFSKSATDIPQY